MKYGGKYWNIKRYLPYQRCFNFIDSERTIGKSYTTLGYFFERALTTNEQFVYFVRTQDELKDGALEEACSKVVINEYPEYDIKFTSKQCVLLDGKATVKTLGHCMAISMSNKRKRANLPNVKWGLLDEYIIDEKDTTKGYVSGWDEPELLLKLYHTIDREEDRLIMFFLANTLSFYNPYHMHPAFKIPPVEKGKIWTSKNVLYHQCEATAELKAEKQKSKFLDMIKDTSYGGYAVDGYFINDDTKLIDARPGSSTLKFVFYYRHDLYGVWFDRRTGLTYISNKADRNFPFRYSFDLDSEDMGAIIVRGKTAPYIKWLSYQFRHKLLRFETQEICAKTQEIIIKII